MKIMRFTYSCRWTGKGGRENVVTTNNTLVATVEIGGTNHFYINNTLWPFALEIADTCSTMVHEVAGNLRSANML
jgi:hypothetical protein